MKDIKIDDMTLITSYIATWGWQILAMMSLYSSFIFFALPRTLISSSFYVGLFLVFIGCQFMALKRKYEVVE